MFRNNFYDFVLNYAHFLRHLILYLIFFVDYFAKHKFNIKQNKNTFSDKIRQAIIQT